MDLKIYSQVKKRYLWQPFVKFLQQLNDYSENDLVLMLGDDFLASHYASLTTKNNHFVWSITLQNLNQFQTKLVFWNQVRGKSEMVGWLAGTVDIEWPFIWN